MTEEEARVSPQSNVISKSLGSKTDHNPDIEEMGYRRGDRFILCTDGVWGSMPHKKLLKFFAAKGQTTNVVGSISSEVDRLGFAKGGHHGQPHHRNNRDGLATPSSTTSGIR